MFAATARQIARMRWGESIAIGRTRRCDRRVVAQPSPTKKPCNRLAGARSQAGSAPQSTHRGHVHSRSTSDAPSNELRPLRAVKGPRCGICAPKGRGAGRTHFGFATLSFEKFDIGHWTLVIGTLEFTTFNFGLSTLDIRLRVMLFAIYHTRLTSA